VNEPLKYVHCNYKEPSTIKTFWTFNNSRIYGENKKILNSKKETVTLIVYDFQAFYQIIGEQLESIACQYIFTNSKLICNDSYYNQNIL
jgi:mRNA-degrading endonuclease HigB of HigAB toxin-antitoxin module